MKFEPMSEIQLKSLNLIPEGEYQFEVVDANDTISKSGNEQIKLVLKIWDNDGKVRVIYDYLVPLTKMLYKVKHFCDSSGMSEKYEDGTLTSDDCIGRSGRLRLGIQVDKAGVYPDKNNVVDYVTEDKAPSMIPPAVIAKPLEFNDDVPF